MCWLSAWGTGEVYFFALWEEACGHRAKQSEATCTFISLHMEAGYELPSLGLLFTSSLLIFILSCFGL